MTNFAIQSPSSSTLTRSFRTVLLDDNPRDGAYLRHLLKQHPTIQLVGEATTFSQGLECIAQHEVDVLFLESRVHGSCILDQCSKIPSSVKLIFYTRDIFSAAQAFDLDAVDFLVKPLSASRLAEALRRLSRMERPRSTPKSLPTDRKAFIPFERGRRGVSLDEISMIQAFGNYTRVSLHDGRSELTLRSLAKWQQLLPKPPFMRVHRNTIVQISQVRSLEEGGIGSVLRMTKNDERIPISRRRLPEVRHALFTNACRH